VAQSVENVRQEWDAANDALQRIASSDRARHDRVLAQIEIAVDELRKQIGETFTLDELARAYRDADRWIRPAVADRAATPGWPQDLALVQDVAFHLYQRGATDYTP
jgi:hypothetical protein